ncbi:MAG: helix-turn-helix transcriptional regulator, partial [Hyphomicrobiales bacterium]
MKTQQFLTTKELADLLRVKERKIYELAGAGEIPCRRVTGKLLFPSDEIDAWLGGSALVSANPAKELPHVIAGSHDPLLDWAIRESRCGIATFFDGSINGLDELQHGHAMAAGIHLVENNGQDWNHSFVKERFADAPLVLMEWAKRQQGMIISPKLQNITSLGDLKGKRIAQRQPTAGAHILFNHMIAANGYSATDFDISSELSRTETEAAVAVAS